MLFEAHPLQSVSCDVRLDDHFLPTSPSLDASVCERLIGDVADNTEPCGETGEEVIYKAPGQGTLLSWHGSAYSIFCLHLLPTPQGGCDD